MHESFGFINDNIQATLYTIENDTYKLCVTDYGATLVSCIYKPLHRDIVLGYTDVKGYVDNPSYMGATIGRVCNRIEKGMFELNGTKYTLTINNGPNSLHSYPGYNSVLFKTTIHNNSLIFEHNSIDMDQGYPGNLNLRVEYELTDDGFMFKYQGISDKDTLFNITNHSYFNLEGIDSHSINNLYISSPASHYLSVDEDGLVCGPLKSVKDTPFDLSIEKRIGDVLSIDDIDLRLGKGFDHPMFVDGSGIREMVSCRSDDLQLTISSDLPSFQLYSGNYLTEESEYLKGKCRNGYRSGICFETQYSPNAINRNDVEKPILKKDTIVKHTTHYKIGVVKDYEC